MNAIQSFFAQTTGDIIVQVVFSIVFLGYALTLYDGIKTLIKNPMDILYILLALGFFVGASAVVHAFPDFFKGAIVFVSLIIYGFFHIAVAGLAALFTPVGMLIVIAILIARNGGRV